MPRSLIGQQIKRYLQPIIVYVAKRISFQVESQFFAWIPGQVDRSIVPGIL